VLSAHGPQVVEAEGAASVSERNDVVHLEVLVASADDAGIGVSLLRLLSCCLPCLGAADLCCPVLSVVQASAALALARGGASGTAGWAEVQHPVTALAWDASPEGRPRGSALWAASVLVVLDGVASVHPQLFCIKWNAGSGWGRLGSSRAFSSTPLTSACISSISWEKSNVWTVPSLMGR
jgi:hypothetical protein